MWNLVTESMLLALTGTIFVVLWRKRRGEGLRSQRGTSYVTAGAFFMLVAVGIDITDRFPVSGAIPWNIADTGAGFYVMRSAYLLGVASILIGLLRWLPLVAALRDAERRLQEYNEQLQKEVEVRRRAERSLRESEQARIDHAADLARAEELQRSRSRIVAAGESMRREIAQRLHGSVQNKLILLLHQIDDLTGSGSLPEMGRGLSRLRQELSELVDKEVRQISTELYPAVLRRGLAPALQSLADRFELALTIHVELEDRVVHSEKASTGWLPEEVRLAAYRVAEEAFTNVLKHAEATKVSLKLSQVNGFLSLSVVDDGRGFEPDGSGDGLGIGTMRDYAEVAGGECVVTSAPGEGTGVRASFPLHRRANYSSSDGRGKAGPDDVATL